MPAGNSIGEHLEILHSLILQRNCHGFTRQQQRRVAPLLYYNQFRTPRMFYLLQAPNMIKIKLKLQACLCHSLFLNKLLILEWFYIYREDYTEYLYTLHLVFPIINFLYQYAIFVITNEPIMTHYYLLKSILHSISLSFCLLPFFCFRILSRTLYLVVMSPHSSSRL